MTTLHEYLSASIQQRIDGFCYYLMNDDQPKIKKPATAKRYSSDYAQDNVVRDVVNALTGNSELYEVVNVSDLQNIRDYVKKDPKDQRTNRSLSATVAAYQRFIEYLSASMPASTLSHTHSSPVMHTTRPRAVVKIPASIYYPTDANYLPHSVFIQSSVPTMTERELMELIVNFKLPLVNEVICFADDVLPDTSVEFSDELKEKVQNIDISVFKKKLEEIKREIEALKKTIDLENDRYIRQSLNTRLERLITLRRNVEKIIARYNEYFIEPVPILGEFIPGTLPKIVLYYKNMDSNLSHRWKELVGVFVHEMFHAWNYFQAGRCPRSVLAVDEPMVEFETLYFLNELFQFLQSQGNKCERDIEVVRDTREWIVRDKQSGFGDTSAYGYGYYLYNNVLHLEPLEWIEAYSAISSTIDKKQNEVRRIENTLIPTYPFNSEEQVKDWFKKVIFSSLSTAGASSVGGSTQQFEEMILACIKILGRNPFDVKDIYNYQPIFATCFPTIHDIKKEIDNKITDLEHKGRIQRITADVYLLK